MVFKKDKCKDLHSVSKNKLHKYRLEKIVFYSCMHVRGLKNICGGGSVFLFVFSWPKHNVYK